MLWLSFGWHRIFIEEATCECERERKQACMTACWVSHCCPPLHSWYSLNYNLNSFLEEKGKELSANLAWAYVVLLTLMHTVLVNEYRVGVYNMCVKKHIC
jgi:hypothetical protein